MWWPSKAAKVRVLARSMTQSHVQPVDTVTEPADGFSLPDVVNGTLTCSLTDFSSRTEREVRFSRP